MLFISSETWGLSDDVGPVVLLSFNHFNSATLVSLDAYQPRSPERQKDNFLEAAEWGVVNGNER